ncbi:hypothetical protein TWF281_008699 [Arthrobotrys megalospora]
MESAYPAIQSGFNSEPLLPLLLCYTPNLESLDLGDVSAPLLYGMQSSARSAKWVFGYCSRGASGDIWNRRFWYNIGGSYFQNGRAHNNRPLWIYSVFNSDTWLPGLANIKEFTLGCKGEYRSNNNWVARNLLKIFKLPRLEILRISRAVVDEDAINMDAPNSTINVLTGVGTDKAKSSLAKYSNSLKRLELVECEFNKDHYQTIAALTGSLQSLKCVLTWESPHWPGTTLPKGIEDVIADVFLRSNPVTLTRDQTSVLRHSDYWHLLRPGVHYEYDYDLSVEFESDEEECWAEQRREEEAEREFNMYLEKALEQIEIEKDEPIVATKTRSVKGKKTRSHFVR